MGKRKIRSLVDAGAGSVAVLDTRDADQDMSDIYALDSVIFECREFNDGDLIGKNLVIACTTNQELNKRISILCSERNILCNIADQPEDGNFIVPSTVNRGDLTLAISTSGKSPALTKRIRRELQEHFGDEYGMMLSLMGDIRPLILSLGLEISENTTIFRSLVDSDLLVILKKHDLDAAREILEKSLPQPLHDNIPELLNGLV